MSTFFIACAIFCLFGIAIRFVFSQRKNTTKLPLGPGGFEVLCKVFQLVRQPLIVLDEWTKEYGSMFCVSIGPKRMLFLNDIDLVKKCFDVPAFSGRMSMNFLDKVFGKHALVGANGPHWEELRRFTLREIRDYGFGKPHIKSLIEQQALDLVESFRGQVGKPVCLEHAFNVASLNSLWSIMIGEPDNQHLHVITQRFLSSLLSLKDNILLTLVPPSFPFAGKLSIWNAVKDSNAEIEQIISQTIDKQRRSAHGINADSRNFLESFSQQVEQKKNSPESVFYGESGNKTIAAVVKELLLASFSTTAFIMNSNILYLVKYPAVQKRIQDEIDAVVGNARPVTISDRHKMPYTQAFMAEVYRTYMFVPISGFQMALSDDRLEEYVIPKGTMLLANVNYINNSKTTWGDPEKFRPERFLEEGGQKKIRQIFGSTFMLGKRLCPGQTFAVDTAFLFLTSILQNFEIRSPTIENDKNHVEFIMLAFFRYPTPFEVILTERKIH